MSLDDLNNGTCSQRARHGSKHGVLKSSKIGFYDEKDKQNVYYTWKLVMLDMLLETGWEDNCSTLEAVAIECLSSACARTGHITEPMTGVVKLILDKLLNIQGKLVQEAKTWLLALGLQPDITLTPEDDMACIRAHANTL
ncbi:hypothetical protein BDR07DRAFT_1490576 [Suillus spraguei]|nr:hypothetical protein BDR07DRAFT_1490576 [Suillus spraguei]